MPYRLSSRAEWDLDEVWLYVAEDASPTTADRLIDEIVDRFDLLAEQPRMGRLRPEFGPGVPLTYASWTEMAARASSACSPLRARYRRT
jgi:plasmid stabilization system protein ParE